MQRPILVGLSQSRKETKKTESRPNHGVVMPVSSFTLKRRFSCHHNVFGHVWMTLSVRGHISNLSTLINCKKVEIFQRRNYVKETSLSEYT